MTGSLSQRVPSAKPGYFPPTALRWGVERRQSRTAIDATNPPIPRATLGAYPQTHLIAPGVLWGGRFADFMADRQKRLLKLIERATGEPVYGGPAAEKGEDVDEDDEVAPELTNPPVRMAFNGLSRRYASGYSQEFTVARY